MTIEVTVFVPFTYETAIDLIEGKAEIYGSIQDYDVVKLLDRDGIVIPQHATMWQEVRNDLIQAQYVYDTVREAIQMEYDAR